MTAISDVAIAKIALSKLGETAAIASLDDDSKVAREIKKRYESLRDAELRRRKWRFAIARTTLPEVLPVPEFGYAHRFNLPSDYLRLISIGDYAPGALYGDLNTGFDTAEYTIEGKQILTDQVAPLKLRYIRRVTDPAQFDSAFVEAFAARLAYEIADVIAPGTEKKANAFSDYRIALQEAVAANTIEAPKEMANDDSWLLSRNG